MNFHCLPKWRFCREALSKRRQDTGSVCQYKKSSLRCQTDRSDAPVAQPLPAAQANTEESRANGKMLQHHHPPPPTTHHQPPPQVGHSHFCNCSIQSNKMPHKSKRFERLCPLLGLQEMTNPGGTESSPRV